MWQRFKQSVRQVFDRMVRNRVTEQEILDWLAAHGYGVTAANLRQLQLYALQRPGWVQIYRFSVESKNGQGQLTRLFGVLRSDERYGGPQIQVFPNTQLRDSQLAQWSEGLIVRRS